jgi:hypothetical protein
MNQINWTVINPGDTIVVDGGSSGMTYNTTLSVGKSGVLGSPITIVRASDTGHNGTAILFGGSTTPLPYCGQTSWTAPTGTLGSAIKMKGNSYVNIDGGAWDGIQIYGFTSNGISFTGGESNDSISNMEVHDNGGAFQSGGTWWGQYPGVGLGGTSAVLSNLTFNYMNIHDNGEDNFQSGATINRLTVQNSWLHYTRTVPGVPSESYNLCTHDDGLQIFGTNPAANILFQNDVLGPGLTNGLIFAPKTTNVTLKNSLVLDPGSNVTVENDSTSTNWTIDHVTAIGQSDNLTLEGTGNTVTNSIFYDGYLLLNNSITSSANNCQWNTSGMPGAQSADPKFVTDLSSYPAHTTTISQYPAISLLQNGDFSLQSGSPCTGLGSSITSVAQLINIANHQTLPTGGVNVTPIVGSVSGTPTPLPTSPPVLLTSPHGILAQDTFRRPNQALWGTASGGQTWGGYANTGNVFSISNNTGQVSNGYGIYNAVLGSTATAAEVLFSGSMGSYSNTNLGAVLRWSDTNNWYKAYINGTTLVVQKKVNGATTIIGSASFAATAGTSYTLRFRVVGTTLSSKVWPTGTTEPTNWMIVVTDATFSSGFCGLRLQVTSGVTANYTSFLASVPGGTPTPTPPPSRSPSPNPGTILAHDTFQRPDQALWGTASDGQTWGADANTGSVFSIVTNTGRVSNGGTTSYNATLGPATTNAEVLFTGSMSSYTHNNLGAVLRWSDTNNWYKAYLDGASLVVQKRVNGAYTILGSVPFTATPGTSYTLRFRVVGTTLSTRVWQTGTTEPTNWMIMVSDTTFSSGFCGLRMLTQNGTSANYTSFLATAV